MTTRNQRRKSPVRRLGHFEPGELGRESRMVDVAAKPTTRRMALARAAMRFPSGTLAGLLEGQGPKGALIEVARAAGLLAAKHTGGLIPMCHPLGLDHLEIRFEKVGADVLEIRCRAACRGRTGVEMEAMVGAAIAALTVYDMTKGLDHGIAIERVELLEKRGGRSGVWRAAPSPRSADTARARGASERGSSETSRSTKKRSTKKTGSRGPVRARVVES